MRLIVHAGFHKTGTSSIQQTLEANRATLAPAYRVMLKADMPGLTEAARAYSQTMDEVEWALFVFEAARVFTGLERSDPRPVLMSSEDLSGHMPFRHGQNEYAAAPRLMAGLAEIGRESGGASDIDFLFTTRAAGPWVKSCYAQHLRATRITDDLDSYAARALPHADLDAMVDRIAAAVDPVSVHRARLEDIGARPLGPLDALLDLAGVDPGLRANLARLPPANTAMPPEVLNQLLALNRSDQDWAAIRAQKKTLVRQVRKAAR
ncbi:hypothetical protein [Pseudooceanicola sp.]|uniref:hypothetical protein n=1 Tax=Pseudooceanicola sp. TaxID=1914328 RepID=UPI002619E92F|nr:hypothetical protein [Pseudooceanicola sp.]MDF1856725.1 hypothetical protein [Pseudooceanicola sp.]